MNSRADSSTAPQSTKWNNRVDQLRQQISLVQHTKNCRITEIQANKYAEPFHCAYPNCSLLKVVLGHLETCDRSKDCEIPGCSIAKQVLNHLATCDGKQCTFCVDRWQTLPMGKPASRTPGQILTSKKPPTGQQMHLAPIGSERRRLTKNQLNDWRARVTPRKRNFHVYKLVFAIYPYADFGILLDKSMSRVVEYARKVDRDLFDEAESWSDYISLVNGTFYAMQSQFPRIYQGLVTPNEMAFQ